MRGYMRSGVTMAAERRRARAKRKRHSASERSCRNSAMSLRVRHGTHASCYALSASVGGVLRYVARGRCANGSLAEARRCCAAEQFVEGVARRCQVRVCVSSNGTSVTARYGTPPASESRRVRSVRRVRCGVHVGVYDKSSGER